MIELALYNPYAYGKVIIFPDNSQLLLSDLDLSSLATNKSNTYYTVEVDDTLDLIAYKMWRDIVPEADKFWWLLMSVNSIENPFDLTDYIGTDIAVPDIINFLGAYE